MKFSKFMPLAFVFSFATAGTSLSAQQVAQTPALPADCAVLETERQLTSCEQALDSAFASKGETFIEKLESLERTDPAIIRALEENLASVVANQACVDMEQAHIDMRNGINFSSLPLKASDKALARVFFIKGAQCMDLCADSLEQIDVVKEGAGLFRWRAAAMKAIADKLKPSP